MFFCLVCTLVPLSWVGAHPLDISSTSLTVGNNPMINATTFFHMFEIEYLLKQNDIYANDVGDYFVHEEIIKQYVIENITITNNKKLCPIDFMVIPPKEPHEIFAGGLEVNYSFICETSPNELDVSIEFFLTFPLQTNKLTVYGTHQGITSKPLIYKVLSTNYTNYTFHYNKLDTAVFIDTDGDGLSNEDELIYKTDPQKIDTDGDFYTDYEEIYGSWDPININPSPGQLERLEIPPEVLQTIQPKTGENFGNKQNKDNPSSQLNATALDQTWGAGLLQNVLKKISDFSADKTGLGFLTIFFFVVLLGFVHAIGPGHSKHILIGYILDQKKTIGHGILFSLIFTITHVIDIVVLFLLIKVFFSFWDPSEYMGFIQKISIVILFVFSIFLLIRAWFGLSKKQANTCTKESKKQSMMSYVVLGFVSGLAPCTFGRSLFFLLFALNEITLILPMLLALGLGIFLCLLLVVFVTVYMRNKIYARVERLSLYSGLISAVLLCIISVYLMVSVGLF